MLVPPRSDPGQHGRYPSSTAVPFSSAVAEGAMTVSMPVVRSSIGSSQPVGWLVTESVLMFRRVKPTVAMPLGASMKTCRFVERYGAESLSDRASYCKRRRSHDHGYQFYESFHIAQILLYVSLKISAKIPKSGINPIKASQIFHPSGFGNNYCRLHPNEI